jgi:hypothetical protein
MIFKKLKMVDVVYSCMNINERLDQLVFDSLDRHHVDMTVHSSLDYVSPLDDQVLNKICETILPRIYHQVNKLTLDPQSIERTLLTVNYPNLYSLSLVDFPERTLLRYLEGILSNFSSF